MTAKLFTLPKQRPWTNAGALIPGAKAYFYLTGTSAPQNTYTTTALSVAHTNPVVADANGVFEAIYLDDTLSYKMVLKDASDVEIYTTDPVISSGQSESLTLESTAPFIDLVETGATSNNSVWRVKADAEELLVQVGNDAKSSFVDIFDVTRTANVVDTIDLKPAALTHNSNTIAAITTGSFTPTHTGFSTAPVGDINWTKVGDMVSLKFGFSTGTSDDTVWTITNWPTELRPDTEIRVPIFGLVDNTATVSEVSFIKIDNSAVATVQRSMTGAAWTGSGTKGLLSTGGAVANTVYCLTNT